MPVKLVFVYNADNGLFNTLTDVAHKLLSPDTYHCQLCAITHGAFRERDEWRNYLESLDVECEFMHRNEYLAAYPHHYTDLPAIFINSNNELKLCLGRKAIDAVDSVDQLRALLEARCLGR